MDIGIKTGIKLKLISKDRQTYLPSQGVQTEGCNRYLSLKRYKMQFLREKLNGYRKSDKDRVGKNSICYNV